MRGKDGIVDPSRFSNLGGSLHQVSGSFDLDRNTVTLTIARSITESDAAGMRATGFLETNGERVQSGVPVESRVKPVAHRRLDRDPPRDQPFPAGFELYSGLPTPKRDASGPLYSYRFWVVLDHPKRVEYREVVGFL